MIVTENIYFQHSLVICLCLYVCIYACVCVHVSMCIIFLYLWKLRTGNRTPGVIDVKWTGVTMELNGLGLQWS